MTADVGVFHIVVRRINRRTMRLAVPAQYVRDHGLQEGDHCVWTDEPDGVRLRFIKTTELAEAEST
jgi:hypothetical protein